ncbi:MAG: hypothetical protein WCO56_27950 [Verrucomicrobiota bacterium]
MNVPSAITQADIDAIRNAIMDSETFIDYSELARRLNISVPMARRLVRCRTIRPAIRSGRIVRFHWPSVVGQLHRHSY